MKATPKNRLDFNKAYVKMMQEVFNDLELYRAVLLEETLSQDDIKYQHDYSKFGREAVIWKLSNVVADHQIEEQLDSLLKDL